VRNKINQREKGKYMRKWFRYVAFPYVWKKSVDEKIIERKMKFNATFEENIDDIITVIILDMF